MSNSSGEHILNKFNACNKLTIDLRRHKLSKYLKQIIIEHDNTCFSVCIFSRIAMIEELIFARIFYCIQRRHRRRAEKV